MKNSILFILFIAPFCCFSQQKINEQPQGSKTSGIAQNSIVRQISGEQLPVFSAPPPYKVTQNGDTVRISLYRDSTTGKIMAEQPNHSYLAISSGSSLKSGSGSSINLDSINIGVNSDYYGVVVPLLPTTPGLLKNSTLIGFSDGHANTSGVSINSDGTIINSLDFNNTNQGSVAEFGTERIQLSQTNTTKIRALEVGINGIVASGTAATPFEGIIYDSRTLSLTDSSLTPKGYVDSAVASVSGGGGVNLSNSDLTQTDVFRQYHATNKYLSFDSLGMAGGFFITPYDAIYSITHSISAGLQIYGDGTNHISSLGGDSIAVSVGDASVGRHNVIFKDQQPMNTKTLTIGFAGIGDGNIIKHIEMPRLNVNDTLATQSYVDSHSGGGATLNKQVFTGGTSNVFTTTYMINLSSPYTSIFVNGVRVNDSAITISGTTMTLIGSTIVSTDVITAIYAY